MSIQKGPGLPDMQYRVKYTYYTKYDTEYQEKTMQKSRKLTNILWNSLLMIGAVMCIAAIIRTSSPLQVSAAGSATLSASGAECQQGGTATVTVSISGNPGIAGLVITPQSNTSGITFSSATNGSVLGAMTSGANLVFDASSDSHTNGTLCTVTFQVAASVAPGTYQVSFVARGCSNAAGETISLNNATGTIKVNCRSHSYGGWSTVSSASCTTQGKEQRSCSACGFTETRDTNMLGHDWSEYRQTKAPTCTADGTKTRTCSRCALSESTSIAATGHAFDKAKDTKAPTCTEAGERTGTCKNCGQKGTEAIPAIGHTFGEWKEVTAPTFSEAGTAKRTCSKCNAEETKTIAALGYEFSKPSLSRESVFVYYDTSATIDQNEFADKGYVNAKFAVPTGSGTNVRLYFVTESGAFEEIAATVSEDGTSLEAQLTKPGTYAVCKILDGDADVSVAAPSTSNADGKGDTAGDNTAPPAPGSGKSGLDWIWIVIAVVEAVAIAGYAGYKWKSRS